MTQSKRIFLIDGAGALVSTLALGLVLPAFQSHIGMPSEILYGLAAAPALFLIYDLSVVRWANPGLAPWLKGIIDLFRCDGLLLGAYCSAFELTGTKCVTERTE